ncbi:uncharacterized protein [Asterias amurensis]|uniref:uncharacterized protein isoform X3 n=1 Tax=Asterias amurensis TaxID=7602 RepID=UPI003AB9177A
MRSLQILALCSLLASAVAQSGSLKCGGKWQQYNGKCYIAVGSKKSWGDARKDCQKRGADGGDLVLIPDTGTNTFLKKVLTGVSDNTWIGLHDIAKENTFKWVDDQTPAAKGFTNWAAGEPNNVGEEDCVMIYTSDPNLVWNDDACSTKLAYVCERSINAVPKCDSANGWKNYNGMCYRLFTYKTTWQTAENDCKLTPGGHLAYAKTADDQAFLDNLQYSHGYEYWLGLSDKKSNKQGVYKWSDDSAFDATNDFSKWDKNQPSNQFYGKEGDCARVKTTGSWYTQKCTDKSRYVCAIPEGACAQGWHFFNGQCYQVNSNTPMTWTDAKDYCTQQSAYLTTIKTDAENNFFKQFLVDMNNQNINVLYFGLSDVAKDDELRWVDGLKLGSYKHWNQGMTPTLTPKVKDCGYITTGDSNDAFWNVGDCFMLGAFICKINAGTKVTPVPPGVVDGSCENSKWDLHGDYCYKVTTSQSTWDSASSECKKLGAELASIHNDGTQSYMSVRMNTLSSWMWIGLNDKAVEGTYVWTDGSSYDYNNWSPGHPKTDDCVAMVSGANNYGLWRTRPCTKNYYYVCQKMKLPGPGVTNAPPPTMNYYARCGNGWEYYKPSDRCFLFRPYDYKNWFNARYQCRVEGGDLMSLSNPVDQTYAASRLKTSTESISWLGCNDLGVEGGWVWTDKKPFVFIDWNPGQPDNWFGGSSTGEHCCQFYNNIGTWNDNYCETGLGYSCNRDDYIFKYYISFPEKQLLGNDDKTLKNIFPSECARRCVTETDFTCRSFDYERNKMTCYLSKTDKNVAGGLVPSFESQHFDYYERDFSVAVPIPTKAPGTDMGCAKGWGRYKGFCYFANLAALEFAEAEKACKNQGAEMASILDMNANNFLRANIYEKTKTITRYWIGLNDKKTEMLYEWSDGTPVTYTNWYAHEPNDANGEDCVEIYTDIGYWNDLNCKGYTFSSICKKPLSSGNPVHLPAATCPTGWTGWNDVCYKMDSTKATWTDAGTQCKTAGGRLVIIEDKYELSFLSAQLGMENGDDFFIGFSDSKTPGLYEWMDGSSVTYTNWAEGQPDDQAGNCVTMNSGMDAGYWTDRDCSVKRRYICEKAGNGQPPLTPPPAITPTQPSDTDCQAGWTGYGTQCFRIFEFQSDSDMVTWDEANRQCINMGANLASFHHPDQQAYLVQQFTPTSSNGFWIGLNDQRKEGGYAWSDGTQVEFTDWAPGEPNDYGGQEECVEIYLQSDNKWNDLYCWYQRNFICQIPKGESVITTPAPTIPTGDPCPGNDKWIHRAPYCYYFSQAMDGVLGWAEAEEFCHKNNAHLVSVHSNDEQSFLKKYASFFASGYWIGLRSNLTHPGEYQWADETNLDFVNWQKGQPDSVNGAELCVEMKMFPNTGEWRDNNCGDWAKFICQKTVDDVPMVTHAPTTPPTGECPNGWKKYNNRCYTIGGKNEGSKKNWQDARKECQTLNAAASLASIHDIAVQTYLTADLIDVNFDVWIGMSSLGSSGNFLWADNTPADYFNWGFNQPDWPFKGNRTDCVLMMNEEEEPGRWNDVDCMALNSYLCVMKPDDKYTNPTTPPKCDGLPEYEKYGDACFKVDIITKRTFEEAKTFCQKDGANVASIRNGYEQAKLQSMVMKADQSVWIGLYDDPATGVFTWIDGWPLYYTNWGWLSPIGLPCAVMKEGGFFTEAGEWSNVGCGMKSYTACKYTTAVPPTKVPDSEGKCPDDWTAYGSSCYIMGSGFFSTGSFPEARYDCQTNYGADLATISSKDENHFVLGLAQKSFDVSWLIMGLHRSNNGGWKWIDGSPVAFTNWANGEPDDDSAGCAEIWPDSQGKWFDVSCTVNSHYVCEMPKLPLFTTEAPFTKPPYCPTDPDWLFVSPYCYYVEDSKEKTWYDAEAWCNTKGGYLASIHDDQEQILVKGLTPYSYNYFWIGLKKLDDSNSVDEYRWSDSSPSDFTNWDYGQPNDGLGMQKCVDMADDGLWGDTNCGIEQHFVCKKDYNNKVPIVKPDPPPAEGNCPNGWFKIDKGCYQINGDTSDFKTWDNARTACKANEGGGLASIHNQAVQSLLTSLMKFSTGNLWTGLSNKVGYYYEYHWSDNSNVDFQHWASNQPSYPYVDTACGVLVNDPSYPGRWDDVDCSEQHGYLCYKPLDPALPTQEPSFGGLCPANGFLQYGTDCFKLMTTPMSFIDAKKACEGQTATLASVRDGFSEAFIVANMLYKNNLDSAWIGLTINDNTGTFKWIDRWPLMFTSWADFEPSEEDGEGCVVQTNSADWDSIKCTLKRAFVCHTTEMVPPTPPSFIPGNCPPKWIGFGDNCYMFEAELQYVSWWEASYFCEKTFDNSHILNIHSRGENAFVKRVAAEKYGYYGVWLGLTRNTTAVDKQEFLWNDGQPLDYTNWKVGEPDNELDSEDCVRIMTSEYGKWEDTGCASYSQLVCKRPKDKSSVGGCEKDWYRMNNLCYGAFGSNEPESLTWTEAYKSCENKGGNLATVYGQNVLSLLEAMMFMMRRTNAWIGLNKIDGSYEWADGTPMQFEHWTENFPDKDPDNMCVMIVNNQVKPGFWKNLPCEGPREGYFCQKPTDPAIPDFPTGDSCSQKGYYRHNGVCYKVYDQMDQRKNFVDAQAQCEKDTGNLATVTDGFVEAFMETLLFYYNIRDAWIGLMQDSTGKFLWVNGDPLVYTNWDEGEPSSNQGEGCVRISDGQKWDNVGCAATHNFICQIGGGGGPIPSTPKPPSCLTGWQQFGSKCYRFVAADNSNMSYDAAKAACAKSSKAVLPDVHSFEQNLFISKYAQGLKGSATIWLGLVKDNQGDFKYDNNAKLDYAKWDTNQPSMDEGLRCVGMNKQTATWTSLSCDVKTDFVCQMDAYGGPRPKPPAQTGLGVGAIIGIVVAVLVIILLIVIVYLALKTRQTKSLLTDPGLPPTLGFDNVLYTPSSEEVKVDTKTGMSDA